MFLSLGICSLQKENQIKMLIRIGEKTSQHYNIFYRIETPDQELQNFIYEQLE
jgi:hypothetical protein